MTDCVGPAADGGVPSCVARHASIGQQDCRPTHADTSPAGSTSVGPSDSAAASPPRRTEAVDDGSANTVLSGQIMRVGVRDGSGPPQAVVLDSSMEAGPVEVAAKGRGCTRLEAATSSAGTHEDSVPSLRVAGGAIGGLMVVDALVSDVPCDIALEIAKYVDDVRSLGRLVCVSRSFYWGGCRSLYAKIDIDTRRDETRRRLYPSYHVLICLHRGLSHPEQTTRTRENLLLVKSVHYQSQRTATDYRALPLLADLLRFCTSLRRIDLREASSTPGSVAHDTFRLHGLFNDHCRSLYDVVAVQEKGSCVGHLPDLCEVHASQARTAIALANDRPVHTLVVLNSVSLTEMLLLLPIRGGSPGTHVVRLRLRLPDELLPIGVKALGRGLPSVECLAIETFHTQAAWTTAQVSGSGPFRGGFFQSCSLQWCSLRESFS